MQYRFHSIVAISLCALAAQTVCPLAAMGKELQFVERLHDADGTHGFVGPQGLALSPDGKQLYVAGYTSNSVALVQRNTDTGALSAAEAYFEQQDCRDCLLSPASVAVSPDGDDVYVVAAHTSTLVTFRRDSVNGRLTYADAIDQDAVPGLAWPRGVAVSPDGANVYVAGWFGSSLLVFSRDARSGRLQFFEAHDKGNVRVGLFRPTSVTVSGDGKSVYVTDEADEAVSVFSRSEDGGGLRFVEVQVNGAGAVRGLLSPVAAALSPDDGYLYVVGPGGLVVFRRDPGSGRLEFVAAQREGVVADDHDTGPAGVAVDSTGSRVYVTRSNDDTLVVFGRDLATGSVRYIEEATDGVDGVDGLGGAYGVVSSSDARFVYVSSQFDDSVAVFRASTCAGDCDGDGIVTVDEIVTAVNIALGAQPGASCGAADVNGDANVTVEELVAAVNAALIGCAAVPAAR